MTAAATSDGFKPDGEREQVKCAACVEPGIVGLKRKRTRRTGHLLVSRLVASLLRWSNQTAFQ